MTSPDENSDGHWLDTVMVMIGILITFAAAFSVTARQIEKQRLEDLKVHLAAHRLHDAGRDLLTHFLPAPILQAVQDRALLRDVDIVAWVFQPACCLQSDIVGFTALGSRISAHQLCSFLHDLFSQFDQLALKYGVHKIETVGCVWGCAVAFFRERPGPCACFRSGVGTLCLYQAII